MSERQELPRLERARRIAAVSKVESSGLDNICVPTTVAFTHGYSDQEFKMGAHPSPVIESVRKASKWVASKAGETVTEKQFSPLHINSSRPTIQKILNRSRASWLVYLTEKNGHMIGMLKQGDNNFLLYDGSLDSKFLDTDADTIIDMVASSHKQESVPISIFSFRKKKI